MFGFTKKEKLKKLIRECSENNIGSYKAEARDWMERGRKDALDEQARERMYMQMRRDYCDSVEEDVVATVTEDDPSLIDKIEEIIAKPSICGYDMDLEKGSFMAGRVYAICYYAIKGSKADPDDCVEMNNMQNDMMNRAMGEITEEYLKLMNGEYVAYNHLDTITEKSGGASEDFIEMVDMMKKYAAGFREKAEKGDQFAQCDLGLCYYYGFGIPKDARTAYDWFERSSKQGNEVAATFMQYIEDEREMANLQDADVQFDLGWSYYTGEGHEKDFTKAADCFRRAARMGHSSAQYNLGVMYYNGDGMNADIERAIYWYGKAADQGNVAAAYNLGTIYLLGRGVSKDLKLARHWLTMAAEKGNVDAQYNVGLMYDKGDGVPQDFEEAARWYEKAAANGEPKAQYNLGVMFDEGRGVPQDGESAIRLYKEAAEKDYVRAQFALGVTYDEGKLVDRDPEAAAYWYALAAKQKDARAMYNLGILYDKGEGVKADHVKSMELYEASARLGYMQAVDLLRKMKNTPIQKLISRPDEELPDVDDVVDAIKAEEKVEEKEDQKTNAESEDEAETDNVSEEESTEPSDIIEEQSGEAVSDESETGDEEADDEQQVQSSSTAD